jgi:hypothetical protein
LQSLSSHLGTRTTFGMCFFAPLRATSKPSTITGHTCTPPRSCSSGDLQRDRVQRLLCLEDDATLRGAELDRLDGDVAICGGLDDSHHERCCANEIALGYGPRTAKNCDSSCEGKQRPHVTPGLNLGTRLEWKSTDATSFVVRLKGVCSLVLTAPGMTMSS